VISTSQIRRSSLGMILLILFGQCNKKGATGPPQSQTGTLRGIVRNAEDLSVIAGAEIRLEPELLTAYTDSAGFYTIAGITEGQYRVMGSKQKFISDTADQFIQAGQTTTLDFSLIPVFDPVLWEYMTETPIYYSTPAVDDGTIYTGTGVYLGTISGSLYAIHPDGTLKWKQDLDHNGTSPVISEDGTIYITDTYNVLYAFDESGRLKWRYEDWEYNDFAEVGQRNVAIGQDRTLYIYVGFDLYALNPDGTRLWIFDTGRGGTPCGASPVVGTDGTIYAILGDNILYAVMPDGKLKWEFYLDASDEHSYTSPALDTDGVIIFGSENGEGGYIYAVYPNGILKWKIFAGRERPVRASATIGPDGTIYAGTKAHSHRRPAELLAISPEGSIKWSYTIESVHFTPDDMYCTPTVGADGVIYFGAETGFIYALNPDGSLLWKVDTHGGINWSSPTLLENGNLYIGAMKNEGGALFALQTQSHGLAVSPWPTFRQNNKNTGRLSD
jgi:outer membrane protein assembly factor BamB